MANSWNIPAWLEVEVRVRDKACVYCGVQFTPTHVSRKSAASWEHIVNDEKIITRENIATDDSRPYHAMGTWISHGACHFDEGDAENELLLFLVQKVLVNVCHLYLSSTIQR